MRRPLFGVCLCLVAAAAIWLSLCDFPNRGGEQRNSSLPVDGEVVTVTGRVYRMGTRAYNTQEFYIESIVQSETVSNVAASRQIIPLKQNLICETEELENIRIGGSVTLQGVFHRFSTATNPGEFDVAKYYQTQNIGGKLTDITIVAISSDYSKGKEALYRLRCYFENRLYDVFPQKEASILTAMLLGDKENLDSGIKKLYMQNGIVHILSISGLHITMIGMGIYKMLRRMGMPICGAAVCGGIVLCLYGVMTGMSLSACRAIGMYLIRMSALIVGRSYDMLTALGVMAVVLIWHNPSNLYNAGFLLSFGSILGIGMLYPALLPKERKALLQRYEQAAWKRKMNELWQKLRTGLIQSALASGAITLFTLPIQLWFYYEVPTYSVLLNLLVLPFMSLVMVSGLVTMLLPGTGLLGTVTCLILQLYEWLCDCFSSLPLHTWNPGKPKLWQVVVYYLIIFVFIRLRTINKQCWDWKIVRYAGIPVVLTCAVMVLGFRTPTGNTVIFLDVGQGDGIVVETDSGEVFLFDCGSSSRKRVGEYVLIPFLKYRGIQHIDAVFVSHGDADHCSGIQELFAMGGEEGITVGQLVLPAIAEEMKEEELSALVQSAREAKQKVPIPISYLKAGDGFATKGAEFLCLHPPGGYETTNSNSYSQCFYVKLHESKTRRPVSLLLTGDVEGKGEELLLQELKDRDIGNVTVLKVAHHGSDNSTSEEFLKQVKPVYAVISCGRDNSYGHPHKEVLERLVYGTTIILRTDENGAIMLQRGRNRDQIQLTLPHSSYHSSDRF